MAETNVDVMRGHFEATNKRDFARAMDDYAEDVVLVVHSDAFLDAGTFGGKEAVGRYFGQWFATFQPGYHFELDELRDLGDYVLLVATHVGSGRTSGIEVRMQTGYHYTLRDGKIVRIEIFADRDQAADAASTEG
jgi:ketosteroid isomerase-like protein